MIENIDDIKDSDEKCYERILLKATEIILIVFNCISIVIVLAWIINID